MSRILFNITHGFQARMLLRSQISATLLESGTELVICSPNANEPYFRDEFAHPLITLEAMPTRTSKWEDRLSTWRQYLLMNPSLGATLNHKREVLRKEKPGRYFATRGANLLLGNIPALRRSYMHAESQLYPAKEFDAVLLRHRPDLVVTGTPGFNIHDVHVLRSAHRLKIASATVMLSWDNLTSKGFMNGMPDWLLVWSDLMSAEAVGYHNFPRERILWTGAAQFDIYHDFRERFDRQAWRRKNKIPEGSALLAYGTINPALVPHEFRIVKEIVEWIHQGAFSQPIYLWIRLHPQVIQGPWRRDIQNYLDLASPCVHVEQPPVHKSSLSWDLPKDDALHLASLLASADVVITPNSTLSIDAACVDTPIVNIFHDSNHYDAGAMTAARFRHYTHYSNILNMDGIAIVETPSAFVPAINAYLMDPALHHEGRKAILRQQLNQLDGRAGKRTADALNQLCEPKCKPHLRNR